MSSFLGKGVPLLFIAIVLAQIFETASGFLLAVAVLLGLGAIGRLAGGKKTSAPAQQKKS